MHGRLDRGQVKLLTRTGLDWTGRYPTTVGALKTIGSQQAYINGENLMSVPLSDRKQRLRQLLEKHEGPIRYCRSPYR